MSATPPGQATRPQPSLDLAVIGNGMLAALIDRSARIVWSCFPRFDGDPVFCSLLGGEGDDDRGGDFAIELIGGVRCTQRYDDNTAVLVSEIEDERGNALEIIDFAPRFRNLGRIFRPSSSFGGCGPCAAGRASASDCARASSGARGRPTRRAAATICGSSVRK